MKYRTQGGPRVYRADGTVVAKADSYIDAVVLADELNKASAPKIMKRYSEDCKPTTSGWYWYYLDGDNIPEATPVYYDSGVWYASDNRDGWMWNPQFWLEMELPSFPTNPEGEA